MNTTGSNMSTIKSDNRRAILYLLNNKGEMSRRDIAIELGLTPAAVTKITSSLLSDGVIVEVGTGDDTPSVSGRKTVLLSLNLSEKYILCINVETESAAVSLCSLSKELVKSQWVTLKDESPNDQMSGIADVAKEIIDTSGVSRQKIIAAVVCVVGGIDENGITIGDFGIWGDGVDVKCYFESALSMNVTVENNVKAFARAELLYGKGRSSDNMLFFKWSRGIGSAIVINGKVYNGNQSASAEIGHYIINPKGHHCRCGRWGCLETETDYQHPENSVAKVSFALANSSVVLGPDNVILFGTVFRDSYVLNSFLDSYKNFSPNMPPRFITLSDLNDKIDFIGPLAVGADNLFFNMYS